ncbi:hypothetical protein K402DRAFT_328891 [Aulographum hederae CBS 113979]|uniref:Uncharacterized protein n=1 Tax=Aulographum hederae CBS 113979 TaxID=1176131 RepID=A0A6G1H5U4_9PEZI|nr:hypothetical protein K402DRAFT_328891 [Aulographum hederae CBS 113979]
MSSSSSFDNLDESKAFLDSEDTIPTRQRQTSNRKTLPFYLLIALTLLSWCITALLVVLFLTHPLLRTKAIPPQSQPHPQTWPGPLPSDLKDSWPAIEYETRVFGGGLNYNESSGEIVWEADDVEDGKEGNRYFGLPSEEIDEAWEDLMRGEYSVLTPSEAHPFIQSSNLRPFHHDGKYHFEPSVFHNLHCLNAVRMHIDSAYYKTNKHSHLHQLKNQPNFQRIHIDHCLDQIRQALMCAGDMTPTPMYTWPGFGIALGRSAAHSCRKWESIREWYDGRAKEMGAVEEDGSSSIF